MHNKTPIASLMICGLVLLLGACSGGASTGADPAGQDGVNETRAGVDVPGDGGLDLETGWVPYNPFSIPQEDWSTCPDMDYLDGRTLAEKAAYYDWIVPALHQVPRDTAGHEAWSRVFTIHCEADVPVTIVPDSQLPSCSHRLSENNGLWTSLYVASQAYRYAVTGEAEALEQLRRTLNGTYQQLLITGKPGLYARDFRDPTLPQQYCIEDEEPYVSAADDNGRYARYVPPDDHMVGNSFVRIDTDGCFETWDTTQGGGAGGWVKDSEHCTDPVYAGYCWQRNASKDEYAGHMFAAGIVARLVDDSEVRGMAVDILGQVGRHLVEHDFWINDYDGRNTRFGSAHAMSLDESPGSNALMALAWIKEAAVATGDLELAAVYDDCLLQRGGEAPCIDQPFEIPRDYRVYLENMGLALGCKSNYDTISIAVLNYFNLIWYEDDQALRAHYRARFRENTKGPDSAGRDLWDEADPFKNLILVSTMEAGQHDPGEAATLIGDAICTLKRFHTDNLRRERDCSNYDEWCVSPRHGSLAEHPIPIEERCRNIFEWWGDPNEREVCSEDLRIAEPPAAYLLPYWMGRYYGFISAEQ